MLSSICHPQSDNKTECTNTMFNQHLNHLITFDFTSCITWNSISIPREIYSTPIIYDLKPEKSSKEPHILAMQDKFENGGFVEIKLIGGCQKLSKDHIPRRNSKLQREDGVSQNPCQSLSQNNKMQKKKLYQEILLPFAWNDTRALKNLDIMTCLCIFHVGMM